MIELTDELSQEDLVHLLSIVHDKVNPDFIFFLIFQCRHRIRKYGTSWTELGTTELKLSNLLRACQVNQLIRELKMILAENQKRPLNSKDAQELWRIVGEFEKQGADWNHLPISSDGLLTIIEMAEEGYSHLAQSA